MPRPLTCPTCKTELYPFQWHKVMVDICGSCSGVWFDFAEMYAAVESDSLENVDAAFAGAYQERPVAVSMEGDDRQCPRDGTTLKRHEWDGDSKIVMDYCEACEGTWLDAGELEGYKAFLKNLEDTPLELPSGTEAEVTRLREQSSAEVKAFLDKNDVSVLGIMSRTLRNLFSPSRV
jgi:Zn-finger nucleic acid-binding protein